jgi:hypothetical protein
VYIPDGTSHMLIVFMAIIFNEKYELWRLGHVERMSEAGTVKKCLRLPRKEKGLLESEETDW